MTAQTELVHFAVTVIGKDRPGIVAGTAEVLFRLGCNIEDSSCTLLAGEYAMILVVTHPRPFRKSDLLEAFAPFCQEFGLSVFARSLKPDEVEQQEQEGEICVLTVYGADRPGIVFRVAKLLAERQVNITDLTTKLVGDPGAPVYVMTLEAVLPAEVSLEQLQAELQQVRAELAVEIALHTVTPVAF